MKLVLDKTRLAWSVETVTSSRISSWRLLILSAPDCIWPRSSTRIRNDRHKKILSLHCHLTSFSLSNNRLFLSSRSICLWSLPVTVAPSRSHSLEPNNFILALKRWRNWWQNCLFRCNNSRLSGIFFFTRFHKITSTAIAYALLFEVVNCCSFFHVLISRCHYWLRRGIWLLKDKLLALF